jgi:hypothetical protein
MREVNMNLYQCKNNLGEYYIIDENMSSAKEKLEILLKQKGYDIADYKVQDALHLGESFEDDTIFIYKHYTLYL